MYTSHNRENKYYSSQGCKSEFGEACMTFLDMDKKKKTDPEPGSELI